ncbi:serpin family protein [Flammeovirga kamogawensis]|uniref:Serpin family protein n=1 Tax=Flammeovirga kamogawensis TaxID=373891 RepID=A0ABX8GX35_9BACT|nr:serpin family protein [Flammeovirga kamogawensis]MBB6461204.1 serpin B [Flammeovirga kamogawensis]QWG07767.1 serpin family protein [Flammeovirga kamogawensis]TRX69573.1 serpin family protein [Flammeovirga kamogawensis]
MRYLITVFFIITGTVFCSGQSGINKKPINDFSFSLLNSLSETENNGNIFISPISIYTSLSMITNGASYGTKSEMINYLGFENDELVLLNSYNLNLNKELKSNKETSSANALWYPKNLSVKTMFKKTLEGSYAAKIKGVDFNKPDKVEKSINNWVANETNDKITNIISDISKDDRMILVNTLYFNGIWQHQFDEKLTKDRDFVKEDGSVVKAAFISENNQLYKRVITTTIYAIDIPYKGGDFTMTLLMPFDKTVKMNDFVKTLSSEKLRSINEKMELKEVYLLFPKLKVDYEIDMVETLKNQGLSSPFNYSAQFENLFKQYDEDLHISKIAHKTFLDVNEMGTEAAAATAVSISRSSFNPEKKEFYFDRPFVLIIKNTKTSNIIFMGVIREPSY